MVGWPVITGWLGVLATWQLAAICVTVMKIPAFKTDA